MKTIGLTFKGESVENVEKHVENTKAPKKQVKKTSVEIEPDGDK